MSEAKMSLEDRQEIYDTLARYVWGMDTGDKYPTKSFLTQQ